MNLTAQPEEKTFLDRKIRDRKMERKMKTIKAGIIGTGFIGPAHVEAARRLGFVEMTALCEANDDLARSKADKLNIPKSYGRVEEFLADKQIEVVHNCTPNHLHFGISKK